MRGPGQLRQGDITKMIKAVEAAGRKVGAIERMPDGRIVMQIVDANGNCVSTDLSTGHDWTDMLEK
jgi:hypothetical protein